MEQEALNEMLITKEDLVVHFAESDDTLENFIGIAKEAYGEAEAQRNAVLLEKFELFAKENGTNIDKVKALYMPKVEETKRKSGKGSAGTPKPKYYIHYEHNGHDYYAYRTLSGQQVAELTAHLKEKKKKMKDLVVEESDLPTGIKALIEKDPNNVTCVVKE